MGNCFKKQKKIKLETTDIVSKTEETIIYKVVDNNKNNYVSKGFTKKENAKNEVYIYELLSKLECDFIPKYHGYYIVNKQIYILLEFFNTSFNDYLQLNNPLPIDMIKDFFLRVLNAVNILHNNSIIYRNIKTSNILISHGTNIKLIDFEYSYSLDKKSYIKDDCFINSSPEFIKNNELTFYVDYWAFGLLLYKLFMNEDLFTKESLQKFVLGDKDFHFENNLKFPEIPEKFKLIIKNMLKRNIHNRLKTYNAIIKLL